MLSKVIFHLLACRLPLTVLGCPVTLRERPPGGSPSRQAALAPQLQHPSLTGAGTEASWCDLPPVELQGGGTDYCNPQGTLTDCKACSLHLRLRRAPEGDLRSYQQVVVGRHSLVLLGCKSVHWNRWC